MIFADVEVKGRFGWRGAQWTKLFKDTAIADGYECSDHFKEETVVELPAWVKVEDKLPPENQSFLAYGVGLAPYIGGPDIDICRWDGQLWNEGGTEMAYLKFTHWMPLPAEPNTKANPPEGADYSKEL